MTDVLIYLNRLLPQEYAERGLAKICLDHHTNLPLIDRIKDNFRKNVWEARFDYYVRYAGVKR